MSRKRKFWLAVSVAAALVVLIPFGLRWRAQWQLNAYRKKLIAAGEKLTVEELTPKRSAQPTNTALFLRLAPTLPSFGNLAPEAMHSIKSGVARVAWRQPQLMDGFGTNGTTFDVWPPLADAAMKNEQTLDELRSLLDAGGIEFTPADSHPIFNGTYLSSVKFLAIAFSARTMLALHQGRLPEAFVYLKSCAAGAQLTAKGPLMVDQMVSDACMAISACACWEALQANGWTDDQLAQLQSQWDATDVLAAAEASLVMERAQGPIMFRLCRSSRQGMVDSWGASFGMHDNAEIWHDFLLNAGTGVKELLVSYPRYWGWKWIWSYQDEQRYLKFMQSMIDTMRDAQKYPAVLHLPAIGIAVNNPDEPEAAASFDVVESMKDGMRRFVLKALRAQTEEGIVRTAIALERYRLAHHAYPAALRDLVPALLHEIPMDGMDGHDLRYRLNPDGTYLLYSVGEDGVDNGGDPTPPAEKRPGLFNGRDWVWPRAGTVEEVQAYEAEQDKLKTKMKH
jgi:hypothetical protein